LNRIYVPFVTSFEERGQLAQPASVSSSAVGMTDARQRFCEIAVEVSDLSALDRGLASIGRM